MVIQSFVYVAGSKALVIGWGIILVTAVVTIFSNGHFDGTLDAHFGAKTTIASALLEPLIDWICLIIPLYILGRLASDSSIRLIDIAGTTALARWPMFFVSFFGFIPMPQINPQKASLDDLTKITLSPSFILGGFIVLIFIVWFVALLYNAFSVSTNLKGGKSAATFIAGLVIAEILSKVIIINIGI